MKSHRVLLEHILESIGLIEQYTEGVARAAFLEDPQLRDSVYRRLEIIGER
ncbi:MAG: HepT-like ribonuclease domain-containing protein [Candidatus Longimicrobiales bacterium M2_2A_002]